MPGKPLGVMPYCGGVGPYRSICNEVAASGMLGFKLTGPGKAAPWNDGEVVKLQPDARMILNMLADMKLPPMEPMGAGGARAFLSQFNQARPAGRPVGEVKSGTLQGEAGPLPYTLYQPANAKSAPPIVVYFHGAAGCWATSCPTIRSAAICAGAPG